MRSLQLPLARCRQSLRLPSYRDVHEAHRATRASSSVAAWVHSLPSVLGFIIRSLAFQIIVRVHRLFQRHLFGTSCCFTRVQCKYMPCHMCTHFNFTPFLIVTVLHSWNPIRYSSSWRYVFFCSNSYAEFFYIYLRDPTDRSIFARTLLGCVVVMGGAHWSVRLMLWQYSNDQLNRSIDAWRAVANVSIQSML